jgi:pentatricopeptide repeat protein
LLNLVIGIYGRLGSVQESIRVFESLQPRTRNVYSWTSVIDVLAQHGRPKEALAYYRSMLREGLKPDRILCLCMVGICSTLLDLERGKEVHSFIDDADLREDVVMKTALVNMYGKCGNLRDAVSVFELSGEKDSVLYGAMMLAYNHHGRSADASRAYDRMVMEGVKPTEYALAAFLGSCGMSSDLARSKALHACLVRSEYEADVVLGTALINAYHKCGSLKDAADVFRKLRRRDTVVWNTMISIYTQHGHESESLLLYREMMEEEGVEPSQVTFVSGLCGVVEPRLLAQGNLIHAQIIEHSAEMNAYVVTALISMYTRCSGDASDAREVFDRIRVRNVESWTALIAAYSYHGHAFEAFRFYRQMLAEGTSPDRCAFTTVLTACSCPGSLSEGKRIHATALHSFGLDQDMELQTSLISMYGKCGSAEDAERVFEKAPVRNVGLWNSLVSAYVQIGDAKKALELYKIMQEKGIEADNVTFASVLTACSVTADLVEGRKIHESILLSNRRAGLQSDVVVGTSLVNMYAKCGDLGKAREVFDRLQGRNDISWNAMIVGYAQNGEAEEAVALFDRMRSQGFFANEVTFTNLLYACSHAGLVDEALRFFNSMEEEEEEESCHRLKPTPEHYACIIDLLGRVGRLAEAERFVKRSPCGGVDPVMWMSLLGACRVHGDLDRARRAADEIFRLDPRRAEPYVLMANISVSSQQEM